MKVLLTGATGFVGRALTARLASDGFQVRAAVRRVPDGADRRVEWIEIGDIGGAVDWEGAIDDVDGVVHLAALAHQLGRAGRGRAPEFMRINAEATQRLARAARHAAVARFVLLSSVAVIGRTGGALVNEDTAPHPDTDYGRSKLAAEHELVAELAGSTVAWSVLRAPLVFGPGNPGNMARLLRLLQRRWPLPFGAIDNARSFLFVDNLVDAIVRTLRAVPPVVGTYFVDDGTRLSTPALCRALASAARLDARLVSVPRCALQLLGAAGDAFERAVGRELPFNSYAIERLTGSLVVDGGRFRQSTGWRPPVAPEEALRRTVDSVTRPTARQ